MIEEYLMNYGVLGLWTVSLIYEKIKFQKEIKKILSELSDLIRKKLK